MRRSALPICLLLAISLLCAPVYLSAKKKKKYPALTNNGLQLQEVPKPASLLPVPAKSCVNYNWVAVLEAMLKAQNARPMTQSEWAVKVSGGDKCFTELNDYRPLMRYVDGDYYLPGHRKVRISLQWSDGPPNTADPILFNFRAKRPLMLIWKHKPYLLYGASYTELLAPSGHSFYSLEELRLIDPSVKQDSPSRLLTFRRDRDDPADIQGVMDVKVE